LNNEFFEYNFKILSLKNDYLINYIFV